MHLIDSFDPRMGYSEFYLAKKQAQIGHDVLVVTSDYAIYNKEKWRSGLSREDGVSVFRIKSTRLIKGNVWGFNPSELNKAIQTFSPDIVHCHGLLSPLPLLAMLLKKTEYALVGDLITGISPIASRFLPSFKSFFNLLVSNNVSAFFACNKAVENFLLTAMGIMPSKVHLIPLGADVGPFKSSVHKREKARNAMGISSNDIVAIYTGKFLPEKRIDDFLVASKTVIRKYPIFKLVLVGDGPLPYRAKIDSLIKHLEIENNVSIVKTVNRKELPDFYNAADFAVWPGTFSISIIEAMACGLPIIIAKSDWTSHYLEYKNGYSFKAGDINHLSSIMLRLSLDGGLRKSMGFGSRKLVEDKLNWDTIATQYNAVYTKVINNSAFIRLVR